MTETPHEEVPEASDIDYHDPDEMLQILVEFAQNSEGFRAGVTLAVDGAVVTGMLTGVNEWLEELHGDVEKDSDDLRGMITGMLKKLFERELDPEARDHTQYGYIHLTNARFLEAGGGATPAWEYPGILWRGRLATVSGWSLGTFGPATDSNDSDDD